MKVGYLIQGHAIWASDEFLHEIMQNSDRWSRMGISLSRGHDHTNRACPDPHQIPWPSSPCYVGAVLRLPQGIYRITRYDAHNHAWAGAWPD